ncbi:hypothetical protein DFH28DRAFT_475455 [Melampsora americana]|nr:hypothetical protein DFH28DRAFT_475455 [Melampsora americana]
MMLRSSRKPNSTSSTSSTSSFSSISSSTQEESLADSDDLIDSDSDDSSASSVETSSSTFNKPDRVNTSRSDHPKLNSNSTMSNHPSSVLVFPSPSRQATVSNDSSPPTQASVWPSTFPSSTNSSSKTPLQELTGSTSGSTKTSSVREQQDTWDKPLDTTQSSGLDKAVVDKKPTNVSASHWPASAATTESTTSQITPGSVGNSTMAVNTALVPTDSVTFTSVSKSDKPTSPQSDIASLNLARLNNHSMADSGSKTSEKPSAQPVQQSFHRTTILAIVLPIAILFLVAISAILYIRTRKKRALRRPSDNGSEWSFQVVEPDQFATRDIKSELQRSGTTSSYGSSSFSQSYHQTKDLEVGHANLPYLDPAAIERLKPDDLSTTHASLSGPKASTPSSTVKFPNSPGRSSPAPSPADGQFLQIAQKFMNARHSSQWIFRSHLPSRLSVKPPVTDVLVAPPEPVALPGGLRSYGQNPSN